MKKQLSILGLIVSLVGSASAIAYSSDISLGGATATPGEFLCLDYKKLYPGVAYIVNCHIQNNSLKPSDPNTYIRVSNSFREAFDVDGVIVFPSNPIVFKSSGSDFKIYNVTSSSSLSIRNLDTTDTISLSNCVARLS